MSTILLLLIILWMFGFLNVPLFAMTFFTLGNHAVTVNDLLIVLVIMWLIGILPYPFQEIAGVLFLLWILASVGIIAVANFSNIVLFAIIIGVVAYIARGRFYA